MDQIVADFFAHYAYSPFLVYGAIVAFMMASAFGLPLPEEVVLISAGLIGDKAMHPDIFPPPYPGATSVNVYVLAAVSLLAVMGSDYLIFWLGKTFGPRLLQIPFFRRLISARSAGRIGKWVNGYGYWTVIMFRFTPGIRFPGHLMCGAMGLSPARFIAVDFIAATLTVPTQVLLMCFYGQQILEQLKRYKLMAIAALAVVALYLIVRALVTRNKKGDDLSVFPIKAVQDDRDSAI